MARPKKRASYSETIYNSTTPLRQVRFSARRKTAKHITAQPRKLKKQTTLTQIDFIDINGAGADDDKEQGSQSKQNEEKFEENQERPRKRRRSERPKSERKVARKNSEKLRQTTLTQMDLDKTILASDSEDNVEENEDILTERSSNSLENTQASFDLYAIGRRAGGIAYDDIDTREGLDSGYLSDLRESGLMEKENIELRLQSQERKTPMQDKGTESRTCIMNTVVQNASYRPSTTSPTDRPSQHTPRAGQDVRSPLQERSTNSVLPHRSSPRKSKVTVRFEELPKRGQQTFKEKKIERNTTPGSVCISPKLEIKDSDDEETTDDEVEFENDQDAGIEEETQAVIQRVDLACAAQNLLKETGISQMGTSTLGEPACSQEQISGAGTNVSKPVVDGDVSGNIALGLEDSTQARYERDWGDASLMNTQDVNASIVATIQSQGPSEYLENEPVQYTQKLHAQSSTKSGSASVKYVGQATKMKVVQELPMEIQDDTPYSASSPPFGTTIIPSTPDRSSSVQTARIHVSPSPRPLRLNVSPSQCQTIIVSSSPVPMPPSSFLPSRLNMQDTFVFADDSGTDEDMELDISDPEAAGGNSTERAKVESDPAPLTISQLLPESLMNYSLTLPSYHSTQASDEEL
ncbi:hypothetical protein M501DRAFT_986445 [Patellaria atrata CBS 101060]|uniref:Uncharacterized protein n=1 Tax=Patellaria atrata CBS 101060 TaxID=1346257 RepID=A0A9P4S7T7_9PEZI|nr:hypothetical protein M501DRAFT_986445 [Patellaria atrata CBS 101060]